MVNIDLGCGTRKRDGFIGVDVLDFPGVDVKCDLGKDKWPWEDNSVDEANASHFIEHLTGDERIHFFNELYRVLKVDAKATIITPHWSSGRAYGDLTHKWPPVVEMFWYYLNAEWRAKNAPHISFTCDFAAVWGYSINPTWQVRNQETQTFGVSHYREVAQDMMATLTKREAPKDVTP